MTTTLGDARIKLKLDTADAEAALRRLEDTIKGMRGRTETAKMEQYAEKITPAKVTPSQPSPERVTANDSPSARDAIKRASTAATMATRGDVEGVAGMALAAGAARLGSAAVNVAAIYAIAKAIQESPVFLKFIEDSIPRVGVTGFETLQSMMDKLAIQIDFVESRLKAILPALGKTRDMATGVLRLGGELGNAADVNNLYGFILDRETETRRIDTFINREIRKDVAGKLRESISSSMGR